MDGKTIELLSRISQEEWQNYYHQLVIYAVSRCNRWTWKTGNKENLPKGFSPESVATEAVRRFFDGERIWNHLAYPQDTPLQFLKSVVRSLVSDLGRSKSHTTSASLETETSSIGDDGSVFESVEPTSNVLSDFNSEREATAYEKLYFNQVHQRILLILNDDELRRFYELKGDGLRLEQIAQHMNKSSCEIEALRRRFSRRTKEIREELFGEIGEINRIPEGGARVYTLKRR